MSLTSTSVAAACNVRPVAHKRDGAKVKASRAILKVLKAVGALIELGAVVRIGVD